jgi:tetratricopeptide (TPR) repeat protein
MFKSSKARLILRRESVLHSILLTGIVAIVATTFSPVFWNEFVDFDDYAALVQNPHFRGLGWTQLQWMFTTFYLGPYQPLSWMSYAFDYLFWGINPLGYHLTNVMFHAANAVLFYFVCRQILAVAFSLSDAQKSWRLTSSAAFAALLFAIHPLRVESVAWATERRDVLSGSFYLATIYCYLLAVVVPRSRPRGHWIGIAAGAYAVSLLSKATSITLPLVLVLLDVFPLQRLPIQPWRWFKREFRRILTEKIPFLVLAIAFAVLALFGQRAAGALQRYEIFFRVAQPLYALHFYLWKTLLPINLSPLYEVPFQYSQWMGLFIVGGTAAFVMGLLLCLSARRWPALLAAWLYYAIVLLPVSGIVPIGPQLVADRYSYLSCLSWPLLVAAVILSSWPSPSNKQHSARNIKLLFASALIVLFILGSLTWRQTKVWRNSRVLWEYVRSIEPNSSIANDALGKITEAEGHDDEAREFYRRAVALNPENAGADFNLARLLARKGQVHEAILLYRTALLFEPDNEVTHNNLALLLALQGETTEALGHLYKAVAIDPNNAMCFFNLARIYSSQGQEEKAMQNYRQALKLDPSRFEIHFQLGNILEKQGRIEDAKERFQTAVKLKPDDAEARVALARILAVLGAKIEAEKEYQEAIRLLKIQRKISSDNKKTMHQE